MKGCAYFKQNTVADEMGISIPTFKRAVRELVEGGHVKVRKGRGRGNASEYTPVLKKPYLTGILPPRVDDDEHTKQKVSPQPPFTDKKGSNETVKGVTRVLPPSYNHLRTQSLRRVLVRRRLPTAVAYSTAERPTTNHLKSEPC